MESTAETMFYDVFISYGREQSKYFANKIKNTLEEQGLEVWLDFDDIDYATDWQDRIDKGIAASKTVVFIISPHSVASENCLKEIELSVAYHKRIIPVEHVLIEKDETDVIHPAIRKINWIPIKEKLDAALPLEKWEALDDFEAGVAKLKGKIEENDTYNVTHTALLLKALEWERNKKIPADLLVGEPRLEAEAWMQRTLTIDVTNPPSPLHYEFITESRKHAEHQMTDVYFSFHPKDFESLEKLNQSLWEHGITTSVSKQDVKITSGMNDFVKELIDKADNFLFLVSEESVKSPQSLAGLEYAFSQQKRVIPIRLTEIDDQTLPESIRGIRYIDLTYKKNHHRIAQKEKTPYEKNIDSLINLLEEDEEYHFLHKQWLVQAKNWLRLDESDSFLLRGNALDRAKQWLDKGKGKSQCHPTALHEQLIDASIKKIGILSSEIFLSYDPKDIDFAKKLNHQLQSFRKTTLFDQEELSESEYWEAVSGGILQSENFLFIISPNSLASETCKRELQIAEENGKRILPILQEPVAEEELPESLQPLNIIDFSGNKFETAFSLLIHSLNTDQEYRKEHTELQIKADTWERKAGKKRFSKLLLDYITVRPNLLLSTDEYRIFSAWTDVAQAQQKFPPVTELQKTYINETKRYLQVRAGFWVGMLILLLTVPIIYLNIRLSNEREERLKAQEKASLNYIYAAREILESDHDPWRALAVAKEGLNLLNDFNQDSIYKLLPIFSEIGASIPDTTFLLEGELLDIALGETGQPAWLLKVNGRNLSIIDARGHPIGQYESTNRIEAAHFSPSRQEILLVLQGGSTWLLTTQDEWQKMELNPLEREYKGLKQVIWEPEKDRLYLCLNRSNIVSRWDNRRQYEDIFNNRSTTNGMALSPTGRYLATFSRDGETRLWDLEETNKGASLKQLSGSSSVLNAAFSGDGERLLTHYADNTVKVWSLDSSPSLIATIPDVQQALFCGGNEHPAMLLTQNTDNRVFLRELEGDFFRELITYRQFQEGVDGVALAQDTTLILTYSKKNTAAVWGLNGEVTGEATWDENHEAVKSIHFSPNGRYIAAVSEEGTVDIWDYKGQEVACLKAHNAPIEAFHFIGERQFLTISQGKVVKRWDIGKMGLPSDAKTKEDVEAWLASIGAGDLEMATTEKIRFGFLDDFNHVMESEEPEDLRAYADFYTQEGRKAISLGQQQEGKNQYGKALELYRKLQKLGKSNLKTDMAIADIALKIGIDTLMAHDFFSPEALEVEDKLLLAQYLRQRWADQPDSSKIDAYKMAVDMYERIIQEQADTVSDGGSRLSFMKRKASNLYNTLAYSYLKTGDFQRALQVAERGKEIDPNYKWINTKLALAYLYNEKFDKGTALLDTMKQDQRFGVDDYQEKMKGYIKKLDEIYRKKDLPTLSEIINKSPEGPQFNNLLEPYLVSQ